MRMLAAFDRPNLPSPTGGQLYDRNLLRAWAQIADVESRPIKFRWFILKVQGLAWLIRHYHALRRSDIVVQTPSSYESSYLLSRLIRLLFPKILRIGIVHHPRWLEKPAMRRREAALYNSFDVLLVISQHVKDTLITEGVTADLYKLKPGYHPATTGAGHKKAHLILWNSHLTERKGPLGLLNAFTRVAPLGWTCMFIAATEPDPKFKASFGEALRQAHQKTSSIVFKRRLPKNEYLTELERAAVFCLPSPVEGYSISTVEAMARGCAVIVPKSPNFIELLGAEYHGFYDPATADSLAELIRAVTSEDQFRNALVEHCKARVGVLPAWEDFVTNAQQVLHQILAQARVSGQGRIDHQDGSG